MAYNETPIERIALFTKRTGHDTQLEAELDRALTQLTTKKVDSEEYAKIMNHVEKLHKMKESEKPSRVSADTWALIAANLAGILLVVGYEHGHVITSKAMSSVLKIR
jgi:hypothetical protein